MEKYKLPWTHECAQNSDLETLLVEYYEDYFDENPNEARKSLADEAGEFFFTSTGDPLLDKWEAEFSKGITPDLEEGLSQEARVALTEERQKIKRARGAAAELVPKKAQPADPRFASKFVQPGSTAEQKLLQQRILGAPTGNDSDWVDLLGKE